MLSTILLLAIAAPDAAIEHVDARVAEISKERPAGAPPVAALLSREFANQLGLENPYAVATYSFEHATRDDVRLTANDWDIQFGNGADAFSVNMVVDDRSRIFDLGAADFAAAPAPDASVVAGIDRPADALPGHVYVVHSVDRDTDLWTRFRVLEIEKGRWVVFEWERIETATASLRRLERLALPDLATSSTRLEIRSASAGGNPHGVFLDGTCTASVKTVSRTPLDAAVADDAKDESAVFAVGAGLVPEGNAFVIESIEWRARLEKGARGPLHFEVWAGPHRVASTELRGGEAILHTLDRGVIPGAPGTSAAGRFAGPIVIRPGDETRVAAYAANGTRCDVTIAGKIVADAVPLATQPSLSKKEATALNDRLRRIDAGEASDGRVRDAAASRFEAFLEDVRRFRR